MSSSAGTVARRVGRVSARSLAISWRCPSVSGMRSPRGGASFETAAPRPPQDDGGRGSKGLRHPEERRQARLEGRTGDCVRGPGNLYLDCRATDYGDKRLME